MGMYPNLPLGGLNSADLRSGLNEEDLFQQLRQKQLQSQLLQANQQAALMAGSGESLTNIDFIADLFSIGGDRDTF